MNEKIKSFMEYVSSDEALKAELKSVTEGKSKEEQVSNILAFAKKHNVDLTKDDIAPDCAELNDDELKAVVGGGACICVLGGEGSGACLDCECAVLGSGVVKDPDARCSQGGCGCIGAGAGATRRH